METVAKITRWVLLIALAAGFIALMPYFYIAYMYFFVLGD